MRKRGQAWGIDIMVAAVLFSLGLVVFYYYSLNYSNQAGETYNSLQYQGENIAKAILSEGYPSSWNKDNVLTPGILSDNRINDTKLQVLYQDLMSSSNYDKTKSKLNAQNDFYITFSSDITIGGNPAITLPDPSDGSTIHGIGQYNSNPKNLIKITRYGIYENAPVSIYIYVWS